MSGLRSHSIEPTRDITRQIADSIVQGMRQMVGMTDYGKYQEHMRLRHPQIAVLSYEDFVVERKKAQFRGGRPTRCC